MLDFSKLHFIREFAKNSTKSNLKAFIIAQYCYGGLSFEETETLFSLYDLRYA